MTTALEGGEGSASRLGRSLPPRKTRYPLYRKLGEPQDPSVLVRKLSFTGLRSPDRPARSQSLYRLRCPDHISNTVLFIKSFEKIRHMIQRLTWRSPAPLHTYKYIHKYRDTQAHRPINTHSLVILSAYISFLIDRKVVYKLRFFRTDDITSRV